MPPGTFALQIGLMVEVLVDTYLQLAVRTSAFALLEGTAPWADRVRGDTVAAGDLVVDTLLEECYSKADNLLAAVEDTYAWM